MFEQQVRVREGQRALIAMMTLSIHAFVHQRDPPFVRLHLAPILTFILFIMVLVVACSSCVKLWLNPWKLKDFFLERVIIKNCFLDHCQIVPTKQEQMPVSSLLGLEHFHVEDLNGSKRSKRRELAFCFRSKEHEHEEQHTAQYLVSIRITTRYQ